MKIEGLRGSPSSMLLVGLNYEKESIQGTWSNGDCEPSGERRRGDYSFKWGGVGVRGNLSLFFQRTVPPMGG